MASKPFMSVSITGIAEVEAALGEFSKATARAVVRRALTRAAKPIADRARQLAPVDTGKLRDSIVVTPVTVAPGKAAFAKAMSEGATRAEAGAAAHEANAAAGVAFANVKVVAGARHASIVEYGTVATPPKPYMRPAFDALRGQAVSEVASEIRDEIDRTRKRVAARALKKVKSNG